MAAGSSTLSVAITLCPSVNNYEITLGIMDLIQCMYKYTNRVVASYVTNITLGLEI